MRRTETIFSKVKNKTRVSIISTCIQYSLGIPSQHNKTGRRNKRNTNWKGNSQTTLFADDMNLYLKDPKNPSTKLLDTINSFSKVAGYKINLQKSVPFLINPNEQIEKNIGK
jgi:hypothetical protein